MGRGEVKCRFENLYFDFAKGYMPCNLHAPLLLYDELEEPNTTCIFNLQHTSNQWWFIDKSSERRIRHSQA